MTRVESRERLGEAVYTRLPNADKQDAVVESVLFAASHPGAANLMIPIARQMHEKGVGIYFQAGEIEGGRNVVADRLADEFVYRESVMGLPKNLKWVMVSGNMNADFEVDAVKKALAQAPEARVVVAEDYPGSIDVVLEGLIEAGISSNLVLTTTRFQAEFYREKYLGLGNVPVIPVGQPAFDRLLTENTVKLGREARKKLGVGAKEKLITYVGLPSGDFPEVGKEREGYRDLNSLTLEALVKSLYEVAKSHPEQKFHLVYRPHPRERLDWWKHPLLDDSKLPINVKVVAKSKEDWEESGLSTHAICSGSDVVPMVLSTVGEEEALSGSKGARGFKPIPLNILLDVTGGLFSESNTKLIAMGASAVARNEIQVALELDELLFRKKERNKIRVAQKGPLKRQYRFKSTAVDRVYRWMRAVERHGGDLGEFIERVSLVA